MGTLGPQTKKAASEINNIVRAKLDWKVKAGIWLVGTTLTVGALSLLPTTPAAVATLGIYSVVNKVSKL